MTGMRIVKHLLFATLTLSLASWSAPSARAQATPTGDDAQVKRLEALRTAGPAASMTMYPVQVTGRPSRNVADVLGLVLEKSGMTTLDADDRAFTPPAETTWEQIPARFGDFLRQNPPASDYALYAEYLGEPKTGPTEVRFILADKAGNLVLSDRQTKMDADFKRIALSDPDPMGCSTLVAERLFSQLGWKRASGRQQSDGKFAKLWADKSGTPTVAEQEAMKSRLEKLKRSVKTSKIAVYSTRINGQANAASAARLAKAIAARLGGPATAVERDTAIQIQLSSNEQKRLWDLARAFREYLKANPPDADYALLGDFYVDPAGGAAHAVHFALCAKSGDWVVVDFQNNQHADFQRLGPRTVEDCERLVAERLAEMVK